MKIILIAFLVIIGLVFLVFFVLAGAMFSLLAKITGRGPAPMDAGALQALGTLSAGEQAILADSVQRGDPAIVTLADQASIDSLVAKRLVVQSEGESGVIHYTVSEAVWQRLRRGR